MNMLKAFSGLMALCALIALAPQPAKAQTGDPVVDKAIYDLVVANRILADQGVVDGYGHISVRHPTHPNWFLISRSKAPATVTTADIYVLDFNGNPVTPPPPGVNMYLERFIHGEIYRTRPDVNSVVHAHAPSVLPFANTGVTLKPMFHVPGFLGAGAPIYEIRDFSSAPTDMLISSSYLGATLASTLGQGDVCLQARHGYVAVGVSIPAAVYRAYYTQVDAAVQIQALSVAAAANALGDVPGNSKKHNPDYQVSYLTPDEAGLAEITNDGTISRPYELWKARIINDVK